MNDPLPSWNEGTAKRAILDFVARVTKQGGADFVPAPARIATFDNDGTLWCERPIQIQLYFAFDRLDELAKADPTLRQRQPYKSFLDRGLKAIAGLGKQAAFEFVFTTHAASTADEFASIARNWFESAKHPRLGRLFKDCAYRPQVELLDHLRANGFRTFIVSGGGVDFMRAIAEEVYGIASDQVVGSSVKTRFEFQNGRAEIVKLAELDSFDDRDAKPQNIYLHIGRRPILAFGNSDGDLPMLRYTRTGDGPSLALLLHHDDAEREFEYDREFRLSPLAEALDKAQEFGITLVSMKRDWRSIFDKPNSVG